ncbi:MFS transporter [Actinomadura algeriensis]|uniref:MFS family permease n=1 Tax=Actinomadura algeriensis TaxID=1679523 RepID=A0ABR9JZN7_9ACTN|nr:MFS transporter [Actinomadura algeriensis]MBE1536047.1 MFS family permease [Actinomadura algeriensis]
MAFPVMLRSLRHHNYRLWATADFVSVTGTWMQVLALNWLILSITGSATSMGLGLVMQTLPTMVLGPWGGVIADRLPARSVVAVGQTVKALLSLLLAVMALSEPSGVGPLYAISLATGVTTALTSPALGRFGAEVVGPGDLSNGLALGSMLNSAGRILGMSLAGAAIPLFGVAVVFFADAASFVAVLIALALMRRREFHPLPPAEPGERGIVAGLRYVLRDPRMLIMFGLAFVLGSLGRNYQVTMAAMADGPLAAGASGYGALSVAFAVGTVLGGVYAASRLHLPLRLLLIVATVCAAGQILSGGAPSLLLFGAAMVPIAAAAVVLDTTVSTRVQLDSPGRLRGRVIAAQGMVGAASGAVGGPALGALCDTLGPRAALVLAGSVSLAAALAAAYGFARVRRARAVAPGLAPAPETVPVTVSAPLTAGPPVPAIPPAPPASLPASVPASAARVPAS